MLTVQDTDSLRPNQLHASDFHIVWQCGAPWDSRGNWLTLHCTMGWGWHSASEHSIHSVVATAGHRTAAERERETLLPQSGPGNVWSLEARQSEWAQHSLGRRQEAAQRLGLAWPGLARSQHYSSLWDQLRAAQCWSMWPILPHTTGTGDRGEHVTTGGAA